MIDNHIIFSSDKALDAYSKCECGVNNWRDILICQGKECESEDCPNYGDPDCNPDEGYKCLGCGEIKE